MWKTTFSRNFCLQWHVLSPLLLKGPWRNLKGVRIETEMNLRINHHYCERFGISRSCLIALSTSPSRHQWEWNCLISDSSSTCCNSTLYGCQVRMNMRLNSSSRITIHNVTENTVQYYLAYLNIPVEYIRFDNEHLFVYYFNFDI